MAGRVHVKGAKELEKKLLALPEKVAKKHARAALRQAMKPVYDAVRAKVPVREGRLRRALRLRVDQLRKSGFTGRVLSAMVYVTASIGPRPRLTDRASTVKGKLGPAKYSYQIGSMPKAYGRFVEFGTVDTAPRPFMRPAWDDAGGMDAALRMGRVLGDRIEVEMKVKV